MLRDSLVLSDKDILGGIPVLLGTRVPVKTLFDYLKANHPLADFLEDFPSVTKSQAEAVLEMSEKQWHEFPHEAAA
jgi:uncharacterized protein (DUF433 family)